MMFIKKSTIFLFSFLCVLSVYAQSTISVTELSCNHFNNASGVLAKPVFGWKMVSAENEQSQTAYQILVSTSLKNSTALQGDVWDSKKVNTNKQININYAGKTLLSSNKYYWRVRVWDKSGKASAWSKPAYFLTGLIYKEDFKAEWITSNKVKGQAAPLMRKSFNLAVKPQQAIIQIAGLGYYELYVNGKKVGDHVLDPGQTNYEDYAFYVTYQIDSLLKPGENVIGVMLGDGFYNQDIVWGGNLSYGSPLLWAQLDMQVGSKKQQVLSDKTWNWTDGPIQSNNVYAGEVYDATKEIKGWANAGLKVQNWKAVYNPIKHPPVLTPQNLQPIKKMAEIAPKKFYKTTRETYMFDMGQNFAGWNRLKVSAPKGTVIKMVMAEELMPDGNLDHFTTGIKATKVQQAETYICKGNGVEIWEPRFTYHGFRYVEVSGLTSPPAKDLLTGIIVYSAVPVAGNFSSSDDQINKLHQLNKWTITSNLHSIPTDCPAREKCGWLGDAHAMGPATIYQFDMQNFWLKFMDDIQSTSRVGANTIYHIGVKKINKKVYKEPGLPFTIAPGKRLTARASPDWGTAYVQLPWFIYTYYGNTSAIEKHYKGMKQWVNHVGSLAKNHIIYEGLGDWCPPYGIENIDCPIAFSSTAFHYNDLNIMKKVAGLLGNKADSILFADSAVLAKQAIIAKFYDTELNSFGSHTANSMALDFGLVPDGKETLVANAIVKTSNEKYKGFMYAGIFGLGRIFNQLSNHQNEQAAFNILTKKGDYSFANMWDQYDATTMWEILPVDSVWSKKEEIAGQSHNHPMQSGFDAYFFNGIGGIKPDISAPGFKKIILQPQLINQLKWAKANYNSVYGTIVSNWKWEGKNLIWDIQIPVNTTSEIVLPNQFSQLRINNKTVNINKNSTSLTYNLRAGKYQLILN